MAIKLRVIGPNQTEVHVGEKVLFFSYNTLVAVYTRFGECFRTNEKHGRTTSKHLNNWCPDNAAFADPETLQKLAEA